MTFNHRSLLLVLISILFSSSIGAITITTYDLETYYGVTTPTHAIRIRANEDAGDETIDYWLQSRENGGGWSQELGGSELTNGGPEYSEFTRTLNEDSTYEFRYRRDYCEEDYGCSTSYGPINTVIYLSPPDAPVLISISPLISDSGSQTISWTASADADRYILQRRLNGGSWETITDTTTELSATVSGLSVGTYEYQVSACRDEVFTDCSSYNVSGESYVVPVEPASVSVSPVNSTNGDLTLSWSASPGATYYSIRQQMGSGSWTTLPDSSTSPVSIPNLLSGSYRYRVEACVGSLCSDTSTSDYSFVALTPGTPSTNATANDADGNFTVSWSSVGTGGSYILQRRSAAYGSNSYGSWSTIQDSSSTSDTQSALSTGNYQYRVRSEFGTAQSNWSSITTVSVLRVPGAPSSLVVPNSTTSSSANISWSAGSGTITNYVLQRNFNNGSYAQVYSGTGTSFTDTGLGNGSYDYRIQACNASGCSTWTTNLDMTVALAPGSTSITAPSGNTDDDGQYVVGWSQASGDLTAYELQRRVNGGSWSIIYSGTELSRQETVSADTTYEYRVRACNGSICSAYSAIKTVAVDPADSDGDGVSDDDDAFPNDPNETADSDGDGVGDNADAFPNDPNETEDTDFDGVGDNADAFPNNPNETTDTDGDGVGDNTDAFPNDASEMADTDSDGVGDNADAFPSDPTETTDTDSDGVGDNTDAFPNDPTEWLDTDTDGIGNNADIDDDGDGFSDADETNTLVGTDPLDASSVPADLDGDFIPDAIDADRDGDGVDNSSDAFPDDSSESADSDNDGVGDNADAFPNDASETADTDGDGLGDNREATEGTNPNLPDTDADGLTDGQEIFTYDTNPINADTDGDGISDGDEITNGTDPLVSDLLTDTDGDGVTDDVDVCPSTPVGATVDANGCSDSQLDDDGDGVFNDTDLCPATPVGETVDADGCSHSQIDTDGDGVNDDVDAFPNDPTEWLDSDGDGVGDNADAFPNDPTRFANEGILREWWLGVSGGNSISALEDVLDTPPDGQEYLDLVEGPVNWANQYGTRISGVLYASVSGDYTFWISGDDNVELWLSTDTSPANIELIANVPGWTQSRIWNKYSQQESSQITLVAGQGYYLEVLHKEGSGGDNVAAGWEVPGTSGIQVISNTYFVAPVGGTDTDNDGVNDDVDAFPNDPTETIDTDVDGIGNNADTDDDGDGFSDADEINALVGTDPLDANSVPADLDGDFIPDAIDADRDGDGVDNSSDAFPDDPSESADTDNDGVGDNADAFPNDPSHTTDEDGDGLSIEVESSIGTDPTNADTDGDGVSDGDEVANGTDPLVDESSTSGFSDNDFDGMNDSWEDANGLDSSDSSDRLTDLDGDGYTNYMEHQLGTDPSSLDTAITYQHYVLNPTQVGEALFAVSLDDNNEVSMGSTTFTLQTGEVGTIPAGDVTLGALLESTGPISIGSTVSATDTPASRLMLGTDFVVPHYRSTHTYALMSPEGDAVVDITVDGVTSTMGLSEGLVSTFNAGSSNGIAGIVQSDVPILLVHGGGNSNISQDAHPVPPARNELWGDRRQGRIGFLEDGTTVTAYSSDGSSATYTGDAGDLISIGVGSNSGEGRSAMIHLASDKPIAASQYADGDGSDGTAYFDQAYFNKSYGLPVDAQYLQIACDANTDVRLYAPGSSVPDIKSCTSDGSTPGRINYGSSTDGAHLLVGTLIESDSPIYMIYEASSRNDEHNLMGSPALPGAGGSTDPVPGATEITWPMSGTDADGEYIVVWSAASGVVTAYELERRVNDGTWESIYSGEGFNLAQTLSADTLYEYRVRACNGAGCGSYSAIVSINVSPSEFDIDNADAVMEGNNLLYTVRRAGSAADAQQVSYSTASGTAEASDYIAISGTLSFDISETQKVISISTQDDGVYEPVGDTVLVNLSSATGGSQIGDGQGSGTINSNDSAPQFFISDAETVSEGSSLTFTVTRVGETEVNHSVSYETTGGTATPGSDYTASLGTLDFTPSESSQSFTVETTDDDVYELDLETVQITLSNPTGGASIGDGVAQGAIASDDSDLTPPTISNVVVSQSGVVTIQWSNSNSDISSFELERSSDDGTTWVNSVYSGAANSYVDNGLVSGDYVYRLRGCDGGMCTSWSSSSPISVMPALSAAYSRQPAGVLISWAEHVGANSYQLSRSLDQGLTWDDSLYSGSDTSFIDQNTGSSTVIYYRLRSCNTSCGEWSPTPNGGQ